MPYDVQIMQTRHGGRFAVSSEQCELLAAFEATGSLIELARWAGRDASVMSRQLQAIARAAPVLEKSQGRWRLTKVGVELARWTLDAVLAQRRVLAEQDEIRIATTREFAARVLSPRLDTVFGSDAARLVHVLSAEEGAARPLLEGRADIGFDCGTPQDPQIRFRAVLSEPFATVISPRLRRAHRVKRARDLLALPYLDYTRASAVALLKLDREIASRRAVFNDIASAREAAAAGLGWAVLPAYAVAREIARGELAVVEGWQIRPERFGVWWLATRPAVLPWVDRAEGWLRGLDLSRAT